MLGLLMLLPAPHAMLLVVLDRAAEAPQAVAEEQALAARAEGVAHADAVANSRSRRLLFGQGPQWAHIWRWDLQTDYDETS